MWPAEEEKSRSFSYSAQQGKAYFARSDREGEKKILSMSCLLKKGRKKKVRHPGVKRGASHTVITKEGGEKKGHRESCCGGNLEQAYSWKDGTRSRLMLILKRGKKGRSLSSEIGRKRETFSLPSAGEIACELKGRGKGDCLRRLLTCRGVKKRGCTQRASSLIRQDSVGWAAQTHIVSLLWVEKKKGTLYTIKGVLPPTRIFFATRRGGEKEKGIGEENVAGVSELGPVFCSSEGGEEKAAPRRSGKRKEKRRNRFLKSALARFPKNARITIHERKAGHAEGSPVVSGAALLRSYGGKKEHHLCRASKEKKGEAHRVEHLRMQEKKSTVIAIL